MTIYEVIAADVRKILGIRVPVGEVDGIGRQLAEIAADLRSCLDAWDQAQAQAEQDNGGAAGEPAGTQSEEENSDVYGGSEH